MSPGGVIRSLRREDCLGVVANPVGEVAESGGDAPAERGQSVRHLRGRDGLDLAVHQAVAHQGAQRLRQHLLADALDPVTQLIEPQVTPAQRSQHQHSPPPGNVVEDHARWTVAGEYVGHAAELTFRYVLPKSKRYAYR